MVNFKLKVYKIDPAFLGDRTELNIGRNEKVPHLPRSQQDFMCSFFSSETFKLA